MHACASHSMHARTDACGSALLLMHRPRTVALVCVQGPALQICGSGTSTHACVLFFPIPYAIYVSPFWRGILVVNYDDVDK